MRDRHGVEVRPLVQDLTEPTSLRRWPRPPQDSTSDSFIYNAGASDRTTTFLENDPDYSLKQIKLDCIGPVAWPVTLRLRQCASAAEAASLASSPPCACRGGFGDPRGVFGGEGFPT